MRDARISSLIVLLLSLTVVSTSCENRRRSTEANRSPRLEPTDYVNPFVGTAAGSNSGNTFPGAALPFGMMQWSPGTDTGFVKNTGSYIYSDSAIRGFSLNHLSGPGCAVLGDVPIMPVVGAVTSSPAASPTAYSAKFSHADEEASPGFYAVNLANGVKAQLTVTTRAGIASFTFPASPDSSFLFEVGRNATGVPNATIEFTGNQRISGSVVTGAFCGAPNKYTVYFAAEFNRPFAKSSLEPGKGPLWTVAGVP